MTEITETSITLPTLDETLQYLKDFAHDNKYLVASVLLNVSWIIGKRIVKKIKNRNLILELDLERMNIRETGVDTLGEIIAPDIVAFTDLLDAIYFAAEDWRVKGIVLNAGNGTELGYAQLQELREALTFFKEKGKSVVAYANTYGELGQGIVHYYLASVATKIYLAPCGQVNAIGLMAQQLFFRELLDKLKIDPILLKRGNYKNAANIFTETEMDEFHRERLQGLLDEIIAQISQGIADSRPKIGTMEELSDILVNGPYNAEQALDLKLIDAIAYPEDLYDTLGSDFNFPQKKIKLLYFSKYLELVSKNTGFLGLFRGTKVAMVTCEGSVVTGRNNPTWKDQIIAHESTVRAIEAASKDKNIKAIIVRIDSGGGSYHASDMIANSIIRAKQKGKKIVVSMGNVAASGGYYISQNADVIVANPMTITGSIGVFLGKFNIRQMLADHFGITVDTIEQSDSSALFSMIHGLSDSNLQKMEQLIDFIYQDFKAKAGKGRGIEYDDMEELAQGKIWMGSHAKDVKLIDTVGGYRKSLDEVRKVLNLKENAKLDIVQYPETSFLSLFKGEKNSRQHAPSTDLSLGNLLSIFTPIDLLLNSFGISQTSLLPFTDRGQGVQLRSTTYIQGF